MALLLHLNDVDEKLWAKKMAKKLGSYPIFCQNEKYDKTKIKYMLVWKANENAFEGLDNLKAIFSLGAGVDALLKHKNLPKNIPIVRFVDEELAQCMSDYVVSHVLMHHRCFSHYQNEQKNKQWQQYFPPPANVRSVGIMGLGELGMHAINRLLPLGFKLYGFSNSQKNIKGVSTFSGKNEFNAFLSETQILVNLLPLTPKTAGILNYENFKKLKQEENFTPVIINAARGGHQKEKDIVKALNNNTLGAASLDVFEVEPLPKTSSLWEIKNCYITPHVAAISSAQTGVNYFSKILLNYEKGEALINIVDIKLGY